jgi:hypothetical protein
MRTVWGVFLVVSHDGDHQLEALFEDQARRISMTWWEEWLVIAVLFFIVNLGLAIIVAYLRS